MRRLISAVRDAIFQPTADLMWDTLGLGPFSVSRTLLRIPVVVTPALDVAAYIGTHAATPSVWAFDLTICASFLWISGYPAAVAGKRPQEGQAVACHLRSPEWDGLAAVVLASAPIAVWTAATGTTMPTRVQAAASLLASVGFMLATTLWRDPPKRKISIASREATT